MKEKYFVNLILSSLLKPVNLVALDIRGNGFLRDDVICVIKLLETNTHLQPLDGIPVVAMRAHETSQLLFSVTNTPELTKDVKSHSLDDTFWGQVCIRQVFFCSWARNIFRHRNIFLHTRLKKGIR